SVYLTLFALHIFLVRRSEQETDKILLAAAIIFRLAFLFSIPSLSDDYFRFIWDGRMMNMRVNPFTVIPSSFISQTDHQDPLLMQLYADMNSQNYYTVYPPVCQFVFAFATWLFPNNLIGSLVVMHGTCIMADIGTIFLLTKLLQRFQLPKENVWWYALNPLVIIELNGNLHFEAVMVFFLLLAIYFLFRGKNNSSHSGEKLSFKNIFLSGFSYALAICSKLIPLLFLPFVFRRLKWKQNFLFFTIIVVSCFLLFLPFINQQLIAGFSSSLDLYFQKFEFNASIYYIIRWTGFQTVGHNIIDHAGPWLAVVVFILVMALMISEKKLTALNFFAMMQWSRLIYLLLATTVHPWYVVPLIMMSVFTGFRFPIVWSLFVILSYSTYQQKPYHENLLFTAIEYAALQFAVVVDLLREKKLAIK
ncbi:MAG: glycosyltransferase 87 family protein, partial [Chitinophagales bacterium]